LRRYVCIYISKEKVYNERIGTVQLVKLLSLEINE
jgi:hypothetical protein